MSILATEPTIKLGYAEDDIRTPNDEYDNLLKENKRLKSNAYIKNTGLEIESLKSENSQLKVQLGAFNIGENQTSNGMLNTEIERLRKELSDRENTLVTLYGEIDTHQEKIRELRSGGTDQTLANMYAEIESLKKQLAEIEPSDQEKRLTEYEERLKKYEIGVQKFFEVTLTNMGLAQTGLGDMFNEFKRIDAELFPMKHTFKLPEPASSIAEFEANYQIFLNPPTEVREFVDKIAETTEEPVKQKRTRRTKAEMTAAKQLDLENVSDVKLTVNGVEQNIEVDHETGIVTLMPTESAEEDAAPGSITIVTDSDTTEGITDIGITGPLTLTPQPEGGYTITSPAMPELLTEGDSIPEALENAKDALVAATELQEEIGLAQSVNEELEELLDGIIDTPITQKSVTPEKVREPQAQLSENIQNALLGIMDASLNKEDVDELAQKLGIIEAKDIPDYEEIDEPVKFNLLDVLREAEKGGVPITVTGMQPSAETLERMRIKTPFEDQQNMFNSDDTGEGIFEAVSEDAFETPVDLDNLSDKDKEDIAMLERMIGTPLDELSETVTPVKKALSTNFMDAKGNEIREGDTVSKEGKKGIVTWSADSLEWEVRCEDGAVVPLYLFNMVDPALVVG